MLIFFYGILSDTFIDWCAAPEVIVRRENIFLPRSDENEVLRTSQGDGIQKNTRAYSYD